MSDNQIGKKLVIWECAESLHSCVTEGRWQRNPVILSFLHSFVLHFSLRCRGNLNADDIALNLFQLAT